MEPSSAGRAARALELLHSVAYFAPEIGGELAALGVGEPAPQYVGARSAPVGAVGAGVVTAMFYNFAPRLIESAVPGVWTVAAPDAVIGARLRGIDAVYLRVLGPDVLGSAEMEEAAGLVSAAARAIPGPEGRPLYAAYADLPWPEPAHLQLWHALTLLREYRGDGHIAALQTAGLSGLDALVTHTATGIGFAPGPARTLRGWTKGEWADAEAGLRARGLLDRRGDLTDEGFEVRELVEDLTDDLAAAPWRALGEEGAERLLDLALPWRDAFVDAGILPGGLFGPRYGDAR
ncbi:SCO6745 family protein [Rhodococcus sp. CH91]|uniref:SCO6745 family protein n=1 Tax=Rhodococcus sp. CH91 TaxID=2910256 RepID=UPI001F4AF41D|nr:hypothetical protein [Rhodococcus sp. CH91]